MSLYGRWKRPAILPYHLYKYNRTLAYYYLFVREAFRGHTDGNRYFAALIKFRAETDQILADHLQSRHPNAR